MFRARNLWILSLLFALGCSDDVVSGQAEFGGPRALALSSRYLFVAATGEAQMRALDLESQRVVRAPNPLFSLAIPTAPLPRALASFRSADGAVESPFVLALSTSAARLSIATSGTLTALGDVEAPSQALSLAIAAMASSTDDTLAYLGSVHEGSGALWKLTLPASLASGPISPADLAVERVESVDLSATLPQVIAASPVDPNLLAIGSRSTAAAGLWLVDLSTSSVTPLDVGGPVSALSFDPTGKRLFGLLDTEACALGIGATSADAASACGGLFAVDVDAAAVVAGSPLQVPGLLRGVAAGGAATLTLEDDSTREVPLLTVVSTANGTLYLVDGGALELIDAAAGSASFQVTHIEPDGSASDFDGAPTVTLAENGDLLSQSIALRYEGALPSLSRQVGLLDDTGLTADGLDFALLGVQAGDRVEVTGREGCVELTVAGVSAEALSFDAPAPACLGQLTFTVRAAGAYVVVGSASGLMGRLAPGGALSWPAGEAATPWIEIALSAGDLRPDAGWTIDLASGVTPFALPITSLIMPGAVICNPSTGDFYVAYQGGNAVLRLVPSKLRHGSVSTSDGLNVFR